MTKKIIDDILTICNPEEPYFYANHFNDWDEKTEVLIQLLQSTELRENLLLKSNAALKIAYIANNYTDFLLFKEQVNDIEEIQHNYVVNFYLLEESVDEMVFDLIIYDNLCFDDLEEHYIDTEKMKTPRIIFFDENCDVKI